MVGFCAAVGVTVGIAVGTFMIVRIGNVIESLERGAMAKKGTTAATTAKDKTRIAKVLRTVPRDSTAKWPVASTNLSTIV